MCCGDGQQLMGPVELGVCPGGLFSAGFLRGCTAGLTGSDTG